MSSDKSNPLPLPKFVFKGKGTGIKLNHPKGIESQWAPEGSYWVNIMPDMITNLPNRHNLFMESNYTLYVLDNYSVHITNEVRKSLMAKGYLLVVISGGITGDVQCNDTHVDHLLKNEYREL